MIRILKNFLSNDEIKSLNNWCLNNYTENFFNGTTMDPRYPRSRLTTRSNGYNTKNINYPKESYQIQKKLLNALDIKNPLYPPPFCNGIVNGIGFEPGSIFCHIDPIYFKDTFTLHCNFITQKSADGGVTIIEGVPYDVDESDCLCYVVSNLKHEVLPIIGTTPRILWCFGFCITQNELKNIFNCQSNEV